MKITLAFSLQIFMATHAFTQSNIFTAPSGNVGIGTTTPATELEVNGSSQSKQVVVRNDGAGGKLILYSTNGGTYNQLYANHDDATKLTLQTYQYLDLQTAYGADFVFNPFRDVIWRLYNSPSGTMTLWGYQGLGSFVTKDVASGNIGFRTQFSDGTFKHEFLNGDVGIGTSTPQSRLSVAGTGITTTKLKVLQNGWADYVFESGYRLPTLREVEAFIKANKHLPDMPSAGEVAKNGLDVGENQGALLKKIEELTLYVIEIKKEVDSLK